MKAIKNSYIKSLNKRLDKDPSNEELWIVSQFLSAYHITFEPNEILKQPNNSKIDVVFNECRFQVKKIIFPTDYKPNQEDESLKNLIVNSYGREQFIKATVGPVKEHLGWHPPDVLKELICERARYWSQKRNKSKKELKYPDKVRSTLDLLLYIESDLTKKKLTGFNASNEVFNNLKQLGWRSVSYVLGSCHSILYVSDRAPKLLKKMFNEALNKK